MSHAVVIVSCPNQTIAADLSRGVIQSRLAACAHRFPIQAVYFWEGNLQQEESIRVEFKTRSSLVAPLKQYILNNHPDRVPEVIVTPITDGTATHLRWIDDETAGGRL